MAIIFNTMIMKSLYLNHFIDWIKEMQSCLRCGQLTNVHNMTTHHTHSPSIVMMLMTENN